MLAAASEADVRRWVTLLESAGALRRDDDRGRVPRARRDPAVPPPQHPARAAHADVDEGLVERLRAWRLERSREDGVPAYVVLHDATLRELAAVQAVRRTRELAGVKGLGPVKIERYGDDLLAVLEAA